MRETTHRRVWSRKMRGHAKLALHHLRGHAMLALGCVRRNAVLALGCVRRNAVLGLHGLGIGPVRTLATGDHHLPLHRSLLLAFLGRNPLGALLTFCSLEALLAFLTLLAIEAILALLALLALQLLLAFLPLTLREKQRGLVRRGWRRCRRLDLDDQRDKRRFRVVGVAGLFDLSVADAGRRGAFAKTPDIQGAEFRHQRADIRHGLRLGRIV